jgi:hypothetical protein
MENLERTPTPARRMTSPRRGVREITQDTRAPDPERRILRTVSDITRKLSRVGFAISYALSAPRRSFSIASSAVTTCLLNFLRKSSKALLNERSYAGSERITLDGSLPFKRYPASVRDADKP